MPRKLGQHFLHRQDVLRRIADAACEDAEGLIIEIGPGRGALTRRLLEGGQRVVAIELDRGLAAALRERFAGAVNLEIIQADVLQVDLGRWMPAVVGGNLPYYITSPVMEKTLSLDGLRKAVFLIQKEVADRLTARPGTREYGYLTVQTQLLAEPRTILRVPPSAFRPPPKVDSAVVILEPRAKLAVADRAGFLEFASRCFRQKRKTLRNNLAGAYDRTLIDALPEAKLRAEQLGVEELARLYERLGRPSRGPGRIA